MAASVQAIAEVAKCRAFFVVVVTICVVLSYVRLLRKSGSGETKDDYADDEDRISRGKRKGHFCFLWRPEFFIFYFFRIMHKMMSCGLKY